MCRISDTASLITALMSRMEKVLFSQVSVHTRLGYPSPRLFPRSVVPGPFWGWGYPSHGGWYSSIPVWGTPRSEWGTPWPGQDGVPPWPGQDGVASLPARLGWGTTPPPPRTEQQIKNLLRRGRQDALLTFELKTPTQGM